MSEEIQRILDAYKEAERTEEISERALDRLFEAIRATGPVLPNVNIKLEALMRIGRAVVSGVVEISEPED